jgi:hypothetical protein
MSETQPAPEDNPGPFALMDPPALLGWRMTEQSETMHLQVQSDWAMRGQVTMRRCSCIAPSAGAGCNERRRLRRAFATAPGAGEKGEAPEAGRQPRESWPACGGGGLEGWKWSIGEAAVKSTESKHGPWVSKLQDT